MGRLTKEMKKAELMEQLTEANEAYLEKISQHMECQYREMQRVERRIERKKKLIDKKYMVSIKKLAKERKEKLKKIVGRSTMFTFGLDMMDQIMTSKEDMTTLSSKELLGGIRHS